MSPAPACVAGRRARPTNRARVPVFHGCRATRAGVGPQGRTGASWHNSSGSRRQAGQGTESPPDRACRGLEDGQTTTQEDAGELKTAQNQLLQFRPERGSPCEPGDSDDSAGSRIPAVPPRQGVPNGALRRAAGSEDREGVEDQASRYRPSARRTCERCSTRGEARWWQTRPPLISICVRSRFKT